MGAWGLKRRMGRCSRASQTGKYSTWRGGRLALIAVIAALAWGPPQPAAAQSSGEAPSITVGSLMLAEPGAETPLPVQIGPAAGIPPKSYVRIRGLPSTAALTEGHAIAPGSWAVPLASLAVLRVRVPAGLEARSQISIALVDVDGNILREAKSTLVIASASALARAPEPAAAAPPPRAAPVAPTPPPADAQQLTEQFNTALRMLMKGDELSVAGNVSMARLYYQRAADMGLARGALALAGTYDANELQRRKVVGVQPDSEQARQWYERARELGAPEAAERLSRLGPR